MNILCLHCGGQHALFWYQGSSERKLCYLCDKWQQNRPNKNTGTPEIRRVTKRLVYSGQMTAKEKKELESIPTVFSKPVVKKEADAHQEKLPI